MKRKNKAFSWPRKLYDKPRILDENKLVRKYGLKNKREIWKTEAKVKYFRSRAKNLITADPEEQQVFFGKLNEIGLKVNSVADVLALGVIDLLDRRLSTVVMKRNLATTPKQARQMIVHKKIKVGTKMISSPSYLVKVNEESLIQIKKKTPKVKVEPKAEEVNEDVGEQPAEVKEEVANETEEVKNE